jgi:diguanylate cyclase (GGDEF)-like protein
VPSPLPNRTSVARLRVPLALCLVAVAIVGGAVWVPAANQRSVSDEVAAQSASVQLMLTAMLDQETGVRGYAMTANPVFLQPYDAGQREYDEAVTDAESRSRGEASLMRLLRRSDMVARDWQIAARDGVSDVRAHGRLRDTRPALARKAIMDRFRTEIAATQDLLADRRTQALQRAEIVPVVLVVILSIAFLILGWLLVVRPRLRADETEARARLRAGQQAEFAETLQMIGSEAEAHGLLQRHLERSLPGTTATVLNRNNSENRLECGGGTPASASLAEAVRDADPRSCLAIRHGRAHREGDDHEPLLRCALCAATGAARTTCMPSLVGGQVIGSVQVAAAAALDEEADGRMRESIAQAAPVLSNLRTLAKAERRAATDELTGLPNARAVQDTLKRLVAQAARSELPLAAVMLDLDRFKALNDDFGHEAGNDVLAAVGRALDSAVRASDFVGRYGGEEFVVLLPDTDADGALALAEKIRRAVSSLQFAAVPRVVTASLGVAALAPDVLDGQTLLRNADRALYAAKEHGRDRVELAPQNTERVSPPSTASVSPVM